MTRDFTLTITHEGKELVQRHLNVKDVRSLVAYLDRREGRRKLPYQMRKQKEVVGGQFRQMRMNRQ